MDHGLSSFPVRGLRNIEEAIDDCIEGGVDAIVLQKGVLSHQIKRLSWPNFIMHVSASTIHAGINSDNKVSVGDPSEAQERGAVAISCQINLGSQNEGEMIRDADCLPAQP